ncbi:MAG: GapR family DNA-binding domain-containing protein [Rhabdaerophilum sp.]
MTDTRFIDHVEAIERIEAGIADLMEDRRDRYAMLKAEGYCPRTTRHAIQRRKQDPAMRIEGDMLLEVYERALNGEDVILPDQREDLRALAVAMLADQIEAIDDPARAALLIEHVTVQLDIRAEMALLRAMARERTALAVQDGFIKQPFLRLIQWIEKCAKHGADVMRATEAAFMLYRGTVGDSVSAAIPTVTQDAKLQKIAGGPGPKPRVSGLAWFDAGAI